MSKVNNFEIQEKWLNNKIDDLEHDKAQLLDFLNEYRGYFRDFHDFILTNVVGSGLLDQEVWDELLEGHLKFGEIDYYAMLGHLDILEKE